MTHPLTADLQVEEVPIEGLRPDPANPRRISDEELDAVTCTLRAYGFVQPVLARRDGALAGRATDDDAEATV